MPTACYNKLVKQREKGDKQNAERTAEINKY